MKRLMMMVAAFLSAGLACGAAETAPKSVFQTGGLYTGCNYWASNAGMYMWRRWEPQTVAHDIKILAETGVNMMRVFPLWPDFQPLTRCMRGRCLNAYYQQNDEPLKNPAGVDEEMMARFRFMCDEAQKNNVKLVVGLVTGFMSGRSFVPPAFEQSNCLEDPEVLRWQVRFVRHFVREMKDHPAICAWDLGNEVQGLGARTSSAHFWAWMYAISAAIRLEDATRPVVSGMHSLSTKASDNENLQDNGELMDELTTHPYPCFTPACCKEPFNTMRNQMHPSVESLLYWGVSGKHCFVEEAGDVGRCTASEDRSGRTMRGGMFSAWAYGMGAYLWWCGFDQQHLKFPPYTWNAVERELGLYTIENEKKPVAHAMKDVRTFIDGLPFKALPPRRVDAVCLASEREYFWPKCLGAFLLSRMAGFDIRFVGAESGTLPESKLYIMPSGSGDTTYTYLRWLAVLEKVRAGATLLVSKGGEFRISDFENITGNTMDVFYKKAHGFKMKFDAYPGKVIDGWEDGYTEVLPKRSKVLARDERGRAMMTVADFGKGKVVYVNFGMDQDAVGRSTAFSGKNPEPYYLIYRLAAEIAGIRRRVTTDVPTVGLTEHPDAKTGRMVVVAVNYEPDDVTTALRVDGRVTKVYRGEVKDGKLSVRGNDAAVFEIE